MKKRMNVIRRLLSLTAALVMVIVMGTTAMAEDTKDYTFKPDEKIDFCIFNTWGTKSIECNKATISSITMTVTVEGFSGDPITTKLYNRESTTWNYWVSEPVVIDGDGQYVYYVQTDEYDAETLCTIYIKDVACAASDEDTEGGQGTSSGVSMHMFMNDSDITFNGAAPAVVGKLEAASAEDTSDASEEITNSAETEETVTPAPEAGAAETESESGMSTTTIILISVIGAAVVILVIAFIAIASKKKKK